MGKYMAQAQNAASSLDAAVGKLQGLQSTQNSINGCINNPDDVLSGCINPKIAEMGKNIADLVNAINGVKSNMFNEARRLDEIEEAKRRAAEARRKAAAQAKNVSYVN